MKNLLENDKVIIHRLARSVLDQLPEADRLRVLEAVNSLDNDPQHWPTDKVRRLNGQQDTYLLQMSSELRAFIKPHKDNQIELLDLVREDLLQEYLKHL